MPFQPGNELGKTDANTGRDKNPPNASELRILRGNLKGLKRRSLEVIKASLEGDKEISKDQVATARWAINTMVTVHKAIVAEENNTVPEAEDPVEEEADVKPKFSLYQIKKDVEEASEGKVH